MAMPIASARPRNRPSCIDACFSLVALFGALLTLLIPCGGARADDVKVCEGTEPAAVEACTRILAKQPDDLAALVNRSISLSKLGQHDKSLADLDRAIKQAPDDYSIYANRSRVHYELGNFDKALDDANHAMKDGTSHRPYYHRANAYFGKRDFTNAIVDYTSYILYDDDFVFAREGRAKAFLALGRLDSALADADEAIAKLAKAKSAPEADSADLYATRGAILEQMNRIVPAKADYNKCTATDAKHQECNAGLKRLAVYELSGDDVKALMAVAMAAPRGTANDAKPSGADAKSSIESTISTKACALGAAELAGELADDYDDILKGYEVRSTSPCDVTFVQVAKDKGCAKGAKFKASGVAVSDVDDDGEDSISLKAPSISCMQVSAADAERVFAAYTPTDDHTSKVVWGPTLETARARSLEQCRAVSDKCGKKPAATDNLDDVFAVMCCSKPRNGCAASGAGSSKEATASVQQLFSDAGFSECRLISTFSARTGEKQ